MWLQWLDAHFYASLASECYKRILNSHYTLFSWFLETVVEVVVIQISCSNPNSSRKCFSSDYIWIVYNLVKVNVAFGLDHLLQHFYSYQKQWDPNHFNKGRENNRWKKVSSCCNDNQASCHCKQNCVLVKKMISKFDINLFWEF